MSNKQQVQRRKMTIIIPQREDNLEHNNLPYLQHKIHYAIQKHFTYYNKVFCGNRLCQGGIIFRRCGGSPLIMKQANEESEFHAVLTKPKAGQGPTATLSRVQ
jgi:hypothetical protein